MPSTPAVWGATRVRTRRPAAAASPDRKRPTRVVIRRDRRYTTCRGGTAPFRGAAATVRVGGSYLGVGVPGAAQKPIVTSRIRNPACHCVSEVVPDLAERLGYEAGNGAHLCE